MISHHQRCVFVHIPKTAGQSVEHVFLGLVGLTWETRAPLLLRFNDRPELGPPSLAHLTAREYAGLKYMTGEQFDSYFKFAFVRNPWARAVSIWKYIREGRTLPFRQFVRERLAEDLWRDRYWFVRPQYDFVCEPDGELSVDFVGRFERLQEDFDTICGRLGLEPQRLPRVNESRAPGGDGAAIGPLARVKRTLQRIAAPAPKIETFGSIGEYYDEPTLEIVSRLYRQDIERFGYGFPDAYPAAPLVRASAGANANTQAPDGP